MPTIIHNRKLHDKLKIKYNFFDKMDMYHSNEFPYEIEFYKLFKKFR